MPDTQVTPSNTRRRKIQAVLAGGSVLGLGAAVTLANWTDEIFAGADFETGTFALEASATTGPGGWEQGGSADDPAVSFDYAPEDVVPGGDDYQDLLVRLTSATTVGGTLDGVSWTVTTDTGDENADNIDFELLLLGGDDECADGGFAGGGPDSPVTLANGSLGDEGSASLDVDLNADGEGPGGTNSAQNLCFVFEYDDEDLNQGVETSVAWEFTAESDS